MTAKGKRGIGGEGHRAPMLALGTPSQHINGFTNPEAPWSCCSRVLYRISLYGHE